MTYYKIIAGNGRTYTTENDISRDLERPGTEWIRIRTTDGRIVFINLTNIAAIETMDSEVREPSEIEQIVNATFNNLFGKPKTIEAPDLGERIDTEE